MIAKQNHGRLGILNIFVHKDTCLVFFRYDIFYLVEKYAGEETCGEIDAVTTPCGMLCRNTIPPRGFHNTFQNI